LKNEADAQARQKPTPPSGPELQRDAPVDPPAKDPAPSKRAQSGLRPQTIESLKRILADDNAEPTMTDIPIASLQGEMEMPSASDGSISEIEEVSDLEIDIAEESGTQNEIPSGRKKTG
jgi:hypothetical protein